MKKDFEIVYIVIPIIRPTKKEARLSAEELVIKICDSMFIVDGQVGGIDEDEVWIDMRNLAKGRKEG